MQQIQAFLFGRSINNALDRSGDGVEKADCEPDNPQIDLVQQVNMAWNTAAYCDR